VPDGPLKDYTDEAVTRARELGAEFADKDREKARLRTWLAWQKVRPERDAQAGTAERISPWNAKRARTEAGGRVRAVSTGVKTISTGSARA
jgi:hypothetical protein